MIADDIALGARLLAARRAIGLTQTQVGQQMGMVTSTISAIEAGKRGVSGPELYRLAQIYRRPLTYFFGDEPPAEAPGFEYLFRQANADIIDRPKLIQLEQLAEDYQLVEVLVGATPLPLPPDYSEFGFNTVDDAETLAEMERSRLGLGDRPVHDLADILDGTAGVRVFLLPVANQRWSGVVVRDRQGRPCIAVNAKEESYRRTFTLAHEYGHVLRHLGRQGRPEGHVDVGIEPGQRGALDERFADAFAAAFLMPRRAVLEHVERALRASAGSFTDEDLVHLAMQFGVSGQAMSLRLVSLRKLARGMHDSCWNAAPRFRQHAQMLGYALEDHGALLAAPVVLPRRFRYLALKAYERGIISVAKLAELLRENVWDLRAALDAAQEHPETTADAT